VGKRGPTCRYEHFQHEEPGLISSKSVRCTFHKLQCSHEPDLNIAVVSNYTAIEWSKQNNEFSVSDTLPASDSMRRAWHCGSARPCSEHTPAVCAQRDPTETGRRRPACPAAVPLSCPVCWEPAAWYQALPTPTSTYTTHKQTFLQDLSVALDSQQTSWDELGLTDTSLQWNFLRWSLPTNITRSMLTKH